jgi:RNA polymerase sigma-70 factor (ECF subfamily)
MGVATITRGDGALSYDFTSELKQARDPLSRYAHRLTGNEAARDDLVQDTLLRAWAARHRFTAGTSFRAWLFRIARNSFLSGRRRGRREVDLSDDEVGRRLTVPPLQEVGLHLADVERAIARLPTAQADAVIAVNGALTGYDEIATGLGIPTGTLRSRVHRGRRTIALAIDRPAIPFRVEPDDPAGRVRPDAPDVDTHSSGSRPDIYAAWKASGSRMIG